MCDGLPGAQVMASGGAERGGVRLSDAADGGRSQVGQGQGVDELLRAA